MPNHIDIWPLEVIPTEVARQHGASGTGDKGWVAKGRIVDRLFSLAAMRVWTEFPA